jgi:hypothetical protein
LELNDAIDELKCKLSELEHESLQRSDESRKLSICQNCESGSKHALHVAIAHMQKQLNIYKKEKEKTCGEATPDTNSDLLKQNEEFRLRLCMGKRAFDKQYLECQKMRNELSKFKKNMESSVTVIENESESTVSREEYDNLLLEFNNLKADNSKQIDELAADIQRKDEQKQCAEKEMISIIEDKNNAVKLNEELRAKLLQLVDHYEGKLNLLSDENSMLKAQVDALLQGGASVYNVETNLTSSPDILPSDQPNLIGIDRHQNEKDPTEIVSQQPNGVSGSGSSSVVERQPALLSDLRYPFDMLHGNEVASASPVQTLLQISQTPREEIATPAAVNNPLIRAEPPSQFIPDRSSIDPPGRGVPVEWRAPVKFDNLPTQKCPICGLDFPSNLSESWKNDHVNGHFDQQQ